MKKCLRISLSLIVSTVLFVGCSPSEPQAPDGVSTLYPASTLDLPDDEASLDLYTAGVYTAEVRAHNGDMKVSVTFSADRIEDIVVDEHSETAGIGDNAIRIVSESILEKQTSAVDAVSGATVTANALITAVEDCAEQAGADLSVLRTASDDSATAKTDVEKETQILIVGAGVSGLAAALTAADAGADVLLIEKMPMIGGTAALAGGGFVMVDSSLNEESAVDDSLDRTINYWKDVMSQGDANPHYPDYDRLADVFGESNKAIEYLTSVGVEFGGPFDLGYAMGIIQGGGSAMTRTMEESARNKGVEFLLECEAQELIVENGVVVGVKATMPNENLTIKADNVILATGGFSKNPDMVAEYTPELVNVYSQAAVSSTGDGIRMAEAIGAGRFNNYWTATASAMIDADYAREVPEASALATGTQLGVNANGERFANEAGGYYSELAFNMIKDAQYPFYFIYDSSNADLEPALTAGIDLGEVFKGDTIEELATALGIDQDTLKATLDHYNAMAVAGQDNDFGKAAQNLIELTEAPFYAVKFYPTTFGSLGGVLTDDSGRVLTQEGSVIGGLFAVGEMSNRMFYNQYYIGGASLSLYSTLGLRIGEIAAEGLNN